MGRGRGKTARIRVEGSPVFLSCQYEKKVSSSPGEKGVKGSFRDRQVHVGDVFQGICICASLGRGSIKLNQCRIKLVVVSIPLRLACFYFTQYRNFLMKTENYRFAKCDSNFSQKICLCEMWARCFKFILLYN